MFLIFSTGFAKKLVGMGRDGFCQAILFLLQLIIALALRGYAPVRFPYLEGTKTT